MPSVGRSDARSASSRPALTRPRQIAHCFGRHRPHVSALRQTRHRRIEHSHQPANTSLGSTSRNRTDERHRDTPHGTIGLWSLACAIAGSRIDVAIAASRGKVGRWPAPGLFGRRNNRGDFRDARLQRLVDAAPPRFSANATPCAPANVATVSNHLPNAGRISGKVFAGKKTSDLEVPHTGGIHRGSIASWASASREL